MRFLTPVLIIILTFILTACGKKGITEKEPNNAFASATPITQGKTIRGFMNSSDDRDVYMLPVESAGILDISLSGLKGINLAMQVWKGGDHPEMMKTVDDARKSSPERLVNLKVGTGTWYIVILHGERDRKKTSTEFSYSFSVNIRDFIEEESEPNDTHSSASEITFDREISGYFSPAYNRKKQTRENTFREEDWFYFNAEITGESPMVVDVALTEVPGVNSFIELYGPDMNLIARSDDNPAGFPEKLSGIGLKASGKYYLMVASGSFQASHEIPYTLKITGALHSPGMELEPNDTLESAGIISEIKTTAAVNRDGDVDFFKYDRKDITSLYRIEVTAASGEGDVYMKIFDAEKKEIARIDNKPGEGMEMHPNLHLQIPFYCGIFWKSVKPGSENTYTLSIENLKDYKSMEVEPNNTIEQATSILGDTATGYISSRDDKDCFLISFKDGSRKRVKLIIKGIEGGQLKASVTDPMGYALKTVNIQGEEEKEVVETIDRKGYILIEPVRGSFESPYRIQITEAH